MEGLLVLPEGLKMAVNYGPIRRFIQPVRVGSRVRLGLTLLDVNEKNPGQWLIKARATPGDRRPGETRLHRRDPQPLLRLSPPQRALPFA